MTLAKTDLAIAAALRAARWCRPDSAGLFDVIRAEHERTVDGGAAR